jgi:hypothetical protein
VDVNHDFFLNAAKGSKLGRQKKGQPLSQGGWPGLSILGGDSPTPNVIPASVFWLTQKNQTNQ